MKNNAPATLLLISALTLCTSTYAAKRVDELSMPVADSARLDLELFRGQITINTAPVNTVTMQATVTDSKQENVDSMQISMSGSARRPRIEMEYEYEKRGWFGWNTSQDYPQVTMVITIPETISLEIDNHRSEIFMQAPAGEISIDDHRGLVEITGIQSDLEISTHRGDISLDIAELHDLEIQTHRGRVDVQITKADDFSIKADTYRGKLAFEGRNIPNLDGDDSDFLDMEFGNGSNAIEIESHRGDIRLEFRD